eukprot:GCRY01006968.1.p1 GENE.GCRY01006968.1~~GCRY01006968.1.p1  ORF type:complete len:129 (+),score=18.93 GCRY01006968.1:598-984(+)
MFLVLFLPSFIYFLFLRVFFFLLLFILFCPVVLYLRVRLSLCSFLLHGDHFVLVFFFLSLCLFAVPFPGVSMFPLMIIPPLMIAVLLHFSLQYVLFVFRWFWYFLYFDYGWNLIWLALCFWGELRFFS